MQGFFETFIVGVVFFLILTAIFVYFMNRNFNKRYHKSEQFFDEEEEANFARRRDIEPEYFYSPNLENLPLQDEAEGDILKKQEHVLSCAKLSLVRFPEKRTNLELKKAYGVANLEVVTGYEENYNRYLLALINWAEALLLEGNEENREAAISVFEHTVEMGSDFRKTYTHLADYYAEKNRPESLNHLLDCIPERFADEGIKQQLIKYVMDKKEGL